MDDSGIVDCRCGGGRSGHRHRHRLSGTRPDGAPGSDGHHFVGGSRRIGGVGQFFDKPLQHLDLGHHLADVFLQALPATAGCHRLNCLVDIADLFTRTREFAHDLAMSGPQVLDLLYQPAFFFLAGEHFMQQGGTHKHDGPQHDGGVRVDAVEESGKHKGDRGSDDGIAERN